jgi:hypothetical protein
MQTNNWIVLNQNINITIVYGMTLWKEKSVKDVIILYF